VLNLHANYLRHAWPSINPRRALIGQESRGKLVKLIHGIPLLQVLATIDDMEIQLRIFFFEQRVLSPSTCTNLSW
jgi:hypothetical protein